MVQAENKLKWCLKKAEIEGENHRGLKKIQPDLIKANKHIEKAVHNLSAMQYLIKGGYFDWAVSAGFYSMYHCLLAMLAKNGYESRNQECTFAAIEVLIRESKTSITVEEMRKIASFDEKSSSADIIKLREEFQYGTETVLAVERVRKIVDEAKELIEKTKMDLRS